MKRTETIVWWRQRLLSLFGALALSSSLAAPTAPALPLHRGAQDHGAELQHVVASPAAFDARHLEEGLRNTRAVGVFTKLSLAGEAKRIHAALLDYHAGTGGATLEQLRERYDLLINEIMLLIQDKDTDLSAELAAAREPLWAALSDAESIKAL